VKQFIQLLHGHKIYLVPEDIRFDADALITYLQACQLDIFDCTPSQVRLLIVAGLPAKRGLTPIHLLIGGEAIDESLWQALAQFEAGGCYNLYGPTECTVAAFKTLLYRHTGQEDLVVGSPVANRSLVGIEPLIGFFVNLLALRTRLEGGLSFREFLGRVREVALEGYAHQELPFEKLVEALHLDPAVSHPPVFQVIFTLHNESRTRLRLPGLNVSPMEVESGLSKFDLSLAMIETEEGLSGSLFSNSSRKSFRFSKG